MKKTLILSSLLLAFCCLPIRAQQNLSLPVSHIEAQGNSVRNPADYNIIFSVSDSPFGLGRNFGFNIMKKDGTKLIVGNSVIGCGFNIAWSHCDYQDKAEKEDNLTLLSSFNLFSYPNGDRKNNPDHIAMIALMRNDKTQNLTINVYYKILKSTIPQDVKSCLIHIPYTSENWTKLKNIINTTFK